MLLWVGLLTYGVFIPLLNYFWDDMAIHWIAEVYGRDGLARYFSTNRPVWGWFYQINTTLLGDRPWLWQIFGLFWRWVAATGIYALLRQVWPKRTGPALAGALLFMVYPGFGQQYIAMVYGHFFLVMSAFFYSLVFSMRAVREPHRKTFYHLMALLLSVVNLFSMEYFFMLELLRPFLLWVAGSEQDGVKKQSFRRFLVCWLPYLLLFLAAAYWRAFLFPYQTENYEPQVLQSLRSQPLAALASLLVRIGQDFRITQVLAWEKAFQFPNPVTFGGRALLLAGGLTLAVLGLLLGLYFARYHKHREPKMTGGLSGLGAIGLSLVAFLLAGIPFWLTGLSVNLVFPFDRFTLPFMLPFCLLWATVFAWLPLHRHVRAVMLIGLVSLSGMHQLLTGIDYQRDWEQQARLFWQLSWRAPDIQPDTVIFTHELPIRYFSDNSLTAALNWIYDPEEREGSTAVHYVLYYPTLRVGSEVKNLQPGNSFSHDLLVGTFEGNTSQSLALFYQPPACLRVLDPEIEPDNWMVPLQVREAIHLSDLDRILPQPQAVPFAHLYGAEPQHGWCYYFEKADLARQLGDWDEVVRLAETAFTLGDHPNDPAERMPFIEGYAHSGNWQAAVDQTQLAAAVTPVIHPALCNLWERIDRQTPPGVEKSQTVESVFAGLECFAGFNP